MDLRDAFHLTSASIRTHKLRSVLAAIGVVLGIGSVIGVVTMGAGFQEAILGGFTSEFDADLVAVGLAAAPGSGGQGGPGDAPNVNVFTDRDVDAFAALPHASAAGATGVVPSAEVLLAGAPLTGTTVEAVHGESFAKLEQGRAAQHVAEATISNLTALRLMDELGTNDVLGTTLDVRHATETGYVTTSVVVVGIEMPSQFLATERVRVDDSFAPLVTAGGGLTHTWRSVTIRAITGEDVEALKEEARAYGDAESDARDLKSDRYILSYDTQASLTSFINTAVNQFTAFIGALGAVALLVGLVGIANIMLVSVSERTREIGVMKATGASRSEVMLIFLVESVAICLVGAILGIGLGMLMGLGLNTIIAVFSGGDATVPFVLVPEWYLIAVGLGIFVGIFAGLYPAWRAAKVSPVEALRYE